MNKKVLIILIIGLIISFSIRGIFLFKNKEKEKVIKEAISNVKLVENLEVDFLKDVKVSDFIESIKGTIKDDYKIDTTKIGEQEVNFEFFNEDKLKIDYAYKINVVDNVAPVVWLGKTYTVNKGSKDNLRQKILCGDNYDANPVCEVIGDYDLNKVGSYKLIFQATDNSGNITKKDFTLKVVEPKRGSNNSTSSKTHTNFSDVYKKYKTDKTEIGIDVSKWQGNIDFSKLKDAGVEFVMIRVGSMNGIGGEYFLDSKFKQNIENANKAGIPVGVYFYSYANTKERAIADANWIIEQIKDYKVDLPIAFDWENWSSFNEYGLSFFGLTDMASAYLDTVKKYGYEGLLYSSKTYLENIWLPIEYPTWLAHYTSKTNYQGEYSYWQLCSNGRVDGINGDVDIDIRYLE